MNRTKFRLAAATLSALAIAGMGAAPAAFADVNDVTSVSGVSQENPSNKSLVNPDADAQLTVHKWLTVDAPAPAVPAPAAGLPAAAVAAPGATTVEQPLQGVKFHVYEVFYDAAYTHGIDLSTHAGWNAVKSLAGRTPNAAEIASGALSADGATYYLKQVETITTGDRGAASLPRPDGVGLYLVNEDLAASGELVNVVTKNPVDKATVPAAVPTFVTLPMTNPDAPTTWMYDVNVYPVDAPAPTAPTEPVAPGTVPAGSGATPAAPAPVSPAISGAPVNTVEAQYADIAVTLRDARDPKADMTGAKFALHADRSPGDGCSRADLSARPVQVGRVESENQVSFTGLQASVLPREGKDAKPAQSLTYCLVQTQSPRHYRFDEAPRPLTIDWSSATRTAPVLVNETFVNEPTRGSGNRPLSSGGGAAMVSGVLIAGGLAFYAIRGRRLDDPSLDDPGDED